MLFDLEFWRQWEGRSLDSVLLLERCAGASDRGAIFEAAFQGSRTAMVKLIPGTTESIAAQLASWKKAAGLSHPALLRIFKTGEATLRDTRCAYIAMERADENLAEVLTERFLTPAETQAMLVSLLGALRYLESKGFAHEGLKPANIMAVGEQLKLSSDSLVQGGDPGAGCRAIGTLLEEVLGGSSAGQQAELPEPFSEIARGCLTPDPAARWNLARIEARLGGETAPAAAPKGSRAKGWMVAAAMAAALGLVAMWPSPGRLQNRPAGTVAVTEPLPPPAPTPSPATPPLVRQAEAAEAPKPAAKATRTAAKKPPAIPLTEPAAEQTQQAATTSGEGITQVLPQIPQAARNTITGRVPINVRVHVDSQGRVDRATLEPPSASKYFTDRVLIAARSWKFPAESAPQTWVLHFLVGRDQTRVSPVKSSR